MRLFYKILLIAVTVVLLVFLSYAQLQFGLQGYVAARRTFQFLELVSLDDILKKSVRVHPVQRLWEMALVELIQKATVLDLVNLLLYCSW